MSSSRQADFRNGIRSVVRGLWTGALDMSGFVLNMIIIIEKGFAWAWEEGAAECGIKPEDYSDEEKKALEGAIDSNISFVIGFGDAIIKGSKANKGKLGPQLSRAEMWVNRYLATKNEAKVTACGNKKLKWNWTSGKDHCVDCAKYNGRVYRASVWKKHGVMTQSILLACHGFKCGCSQDPTDDPITPGFPPAPTG